ncbi:hypothetical protein B296_00008965 [Ensete ventricosum]|uniref:ENTH domain-containing protein n=1 Tax=Ensete ventricosum TaxID=4639 RepID=A0A427A448_ENSVE|nr:hypothetical protein B296_00008965 [Ensete ventricosum]
MAPSIRKAMGAVKDQTSIGLAMMSGNVAPELDVAIVKATSHDDEPADEKYLREILNMTSYSGSCVIACVAAVSRRLAKTRDWVVALKALMLVHRLLTDGDPAFQHEILYANRSGARLLRMSRFRDEAHSNSWDHSAFVRTYAFYLDRRLECMGYEGNRGGGDRRSPLPIPYAHGNHGRSSYSSYPGNGNGEYRGRRNGEDRKPRTPLKDMKTESVLGRMHELLNVLDSFLACRPKGDAKHSSLILVALYPLLWESFQLYADIAEILAILLDGFFDMDYHDCVKSFEAYARAAKQIDELCAFYAWCKYTGVARSSEYPEVERITDKILELLEEFTRNRARRTKSPPREAAVPVAPTETRDEEPDEAMNSIKALPAPPDSEEEEPEPAKVAAEPVEEQQQPQPHQQQGDLVDLRDDSASAEDNLELALFQAPVAANGSNASWEAFPSSDGETGVTSAWQNPAAESGKADWETMLVETASNLSKQKATLGGGLDPLLLNGMYDAGAVTQHVNAQASGGSASSVALPGPGRGGAAPVLALPAPDGTVKPIGQDPFAASLVIPPPPFVQMADAEMKQQLLVQEQVMWQQYANNGMQGQAGLADKPSSNFMPNPYGMPSASNNTAGGYHYPTY